MDKALENSKREFSSIRTGKASHDAARHGARRGVRPADAAEPGRERRRARAARCSWSRRATRALTQAIEKAIRDSDLGLDPRAQGGIIRVPLPSLNEQRRKELVKVVHKLAEEGRIGVRHARTEARDKLKKLDKVPEDEEKRAEKDLQKTHDEYIAKIDELLKAKEAEIMEV